MKNSLILCLFLFFFPGLVFAGCSADGATVVYINGVETMEQEAKTDMSLLRTAFQSNGGQADVSFITGYNPVHLDGLGDDIQSISQAFDQPISDFDLDTILNQIASEVTSRKLLLVGHSQGSFYANEVYDYLTQNGVPAAAISVYNIATPANFAAGGGSYLNSANDKVINTIRGLDELLRAPVALPANITIPKEAGYDQNPWAGHLPSVYFINASHRVAQDMRSAIARLSASGDSAGACLPAPKFGLSYNAQKIAFAAADPLVAGIDTAGSDILKAVSSVSILPKMNAQNAAGVFSVEKALYGSSLSVANYEALASGKDIPEIEPAPTAATVALQQTATSSQSVSNVQPQHPVEVVNATSSTTTIPTATAAPAANPIPAPFPIFTSPGFGGGGGGTAPAPVPQEASAISSSSDSSSTEAASSTQSSGNAATSSAPTSNDAASSTTSTAETSGGNPATSSSATSTAPQEATSTPPATTSSAPFTDHFDVDDLASWTGMVDGTFQFDSSTADCYVNSCIYNNTHNASENMYRIGTPLSAGSAVLYFRNSGYQAQITFGICNDSGCSNNNVVGVYATPFPIFSKAWHYWFLAWREGTTDEEVCWLTDDANRDHCVWSDSNLPKGPFDGLLIEENAAMSFGGAIYFDELSSAPYVQL